jgi:hypothetical protein
MGNTERNKNFKRRLKINSSYEPEEKVFLTNALKADEAGVL